MPTFNFQPMIQPQSFLGSGEKKIFQAFLTIYGQDRHLV